jgi:hypothetical protein
MSQRGIVSSFLYNEFEDLGKYGYQIIRNTISETEVNEVRNEILQDVNILRKQNSHIDLKILQQYGAGQWESM